MNTGILRVVLIVSMVIFLYSCKKDNKQSPDKIVNYQIERITGPNTFLRYIYDTTNTLIRVTGKDSDKSLACDISYEGNKVFIDYQNLTANEQWNITLEVNDKGYFTKYDDGLFKAVFVYDSSRFLDRKERLVVTYYNDGKYKGDTLFHHAVYDEIGNLTACISNHEDNEISYYTDEKYDAILSTLYVEKVLNRFNKIIAYLPYTFGEMPKYLPKVAIRKKAYYTEYKYDKDEFDRVKTEYINGAAYNYFYLK